MNNLKCVVKLGQALHVLQNLYVKRVCANHLKWAVGSVSILENHGCLKYPRVERLDLWIIR